jgi:hypothetical protein
MAALALLAGVEPAAAQTDYYNTDSGRPVVIEDAHPVERYAFETQLAPLRTERSDDGAYHWEFEPELAYGILPGTQVEIGIHLDATDQEGGGRAFGVGGVEIAAFHNLNLETATVPALAIAAEALLPIGGFAPDGIFPTLKGVATRTFRWMRIHVNAGYTFGDDPRLENGSTDLSRWMAGVAVDRALPLLGALFVGDVFVTEPLAPGDELAWTAEAGARYQLDPFVALDIGIGRRLNGSDPAWFLTVGAARTFGLRSLIPGSTE